MVDAENVSSRLDRLAERLGSAADMRNVLVHGYLDVDDEAVWDAFGRLDDLREFAGAVRTIADG